MGATLASGGRNPLTGERVIGAACARDVLTVIIAVAVALGTGLYGIEHRIEPTAPVEDNAYEMKTPAKLALPRTLFEAAQALFQFGRFSVVAAEESGSPAVVADQVFDCGCIRGVDVDRILKCHTGLFRKSDRPAPGCLFRHVTVRPAEQVRAFGAFGLQ